jgi:hypothetical protein
VNGCRLQFAFLSAEAEAEDEAKEKAENKS